MSNLVEHAKRELELLSEEDEAFKASIIKAVEGFDSYPGHSGGSASIAIEILHQLLQYNNLTPLTDSPNEWFFHGEDTWGAPGGVWQNKRNGAAFSHDGGKTYYLVSEGGNNQKFADGEAKMYTSRHHGDELVNAAGEPI